MQTRRVNYSQRVNYGRSPRQVRTTWVDYLACAYMLFAIVFIVFLAAASHN